jgi:hypothetical protein
MVASAFCLRNKIPEMLLLGRVSLCCIVSFRSAYFFGTPLASTVRRTVPTGTALTEKVPSARVLVCAG